MTRLGWLPLLLVLGAWDPILKKQPDVAGGNESLKAGQADDAEAQYRRALAELPGAPAVLYNLGTAQVQRAARLPAGDERSKLLESAERMLREAGDAADTGLRASSHYNLGNALYAEKKYKDAIDEYKKALRLEPAREDARHNLELALSRLPPPKQDPKQPKGQQKPDDEQSDKNQQSRSGQDEQKQDDQKPEPQQGDQQKSDDQKDTSSQQQADGQAEAQPQDKKDGPGQAESQAGDEKNAEQKRSAAGDPRNGERDMNQKLDLLEDYSKNLQVQKAQDRARERRRGKPAKDW